MQLSVDHLLYAGPELEELVLDLRTRARLEASPGGRHAGWGTHNALAGLGPKRYLELIAPEPDGDGPWARLFSRLPAPSLQAWCVRVEDADEIAGLLSAAGLQSRRIPGGRSLPGGGRLRWELVFPVTHAFGGLVPFFIDWQDSAHPATRLPQVASLESLRLEHPDAQGLRDLLLSLGQLPGAVEVVSSDRSALAAELTGPGGGFRLEGLVSSVAYLGEA